MFAGTGGIDSWIGAATDERVIARLRRLPDEPLSRAQLNQLLVLGHEVGVSAHFFSYYWLEAPIHPYDVTKVADYDSAWTGKGTRKILSLSHLKWGLARLYADCLLYFGNIRSGYRFLRAADRQELVEFFGTRRMDTEGLRPRGEALALDQIAIADRHLVAEMACKSLDDPSDVQEQLLTAYRQAVVKGTKRVSVKSLLSKEYLLEKFVNREEEFLLATDDILEQEVHSEDELQLAIKRLATQFRQARTRALANTRLYLSMAGDMDVYVATSMRTRQDFRDMAGFCNRIFSDADLKQLFPRYFDPTLSAAAGHEDKGLIECLMVKCADVLVYCAGLKESMGKDFEAAMALSQGKPVIFFCPAPRLPFYRDVHPLTRLIDFNTGVAVGAMVTANEDTVSKLLYRIFTNTMEYQLEQSDDGYLRLREKLTGCVVRLQTKDELLRSTFWNYYHHKKALAQTVPALQ
jgi:hypothetical protein